MVLKGKKWGVIAAVALAGLLPIDAFARTVDYKGGEVPVYVTPGEPTQVKFPGLISGGFKKKSSALSLDRKQTDLVIFANEKIADSGEAIIVRLDDGRSYSLRIIRASDENPRDEQISVVEKKDGIIQDNVEESAAATPSVEQQFEYAPPSQISGLMREMVLVTEFGKKNVPGYKATDVYNGQVVLNDGSVYATIENIYLGPNLWGYVINAKNLLDQTQRINPATFRIDGTRAISFKNWELSPRPMDIEQQITGKHETKVYIVTRSK